MALSEFEQFRCEKLLQEFCDLQGPPPELHDKVKWDFVVEPGKQTVEMFEIRPYYDEPKEKVRIPFARARYVKTRDQWNVYWMGGSGKWIAYEPCLSVQTLEEFLDLIKEDVYCCFFG
jgi:hypothetical protein